MAHSIPEQRPPTADDALGELARRRAGIFTRADALAAGIPADEIRDRLRSGVWLVESGNVLRAATTPDGLEVRERAALARAGEGAALSHLSAARRWQLRVPEPAQVWVTVPYARSPRCPPGVRLVRSRHVPASVVRRVQGFPVLSAARTVADLARCLDERRLVAVVLEAMQRRLCTHAEVQAWQVQLGGRAGTAALAAALRQADPKFESILAAEFGRLVASAGVVLVAGFVLRLPTGHEVTCDFADPVARIDFEVDGLAFHSSRQQLIDDRARDRRLLMAGWVTVRYVADDIRRRPTETLADVLRQIAQRHGSS